MNSEPTLAVRCKIISLSLHGFLLKLLYLIIRGIRNIVAFNSREQLAKCFINWYVLFLRVSVVQLVLPSIIFFIISVCIFIISGFCLLNCVYAICNVFYAIVTMLICPEKTSQI